MNVEFWSCCEDVCFSARIFKFGLCENFHSHCIDSVMFVVCKVYDNFLETVIRSSLKCDGLMKWFISNEADMSRTEFKEFSVVAFLTLKEFFLALFYFGDVKNGVKGCLHGLFWELFSCWIFLENNFFGLFCLSM